MVPDRSFTNVCGGVHATRSAAEGAISPESGKTGKAKWQSDRETVDGAMVGPAAVVEGAAVQGSKGGDNPNWPSRTCDPPGGSGGKIPPEK